MKRILVTTFSLLFMFINSLSSQVTLSPELGISYAPYRLINYNSEVHQHKLDFLVGISGSIPFTPKVFLQTRIQLILRQNAEYHGSDLGFNPKYKGYTFSKNELNISFTGYHKVSNQVSIGMGIGFIYDLKSEIIADYTDFKEMENVQNKFLPFGNVSLQYHHDFILFRLTFKRLVIKEHFNSAHILSKIGSNDLRFSIGYIIGN